MWTYMYLRSTVYHNNILPSAACTLDHFYTLPAKGIRNTALMSVSAEGISSYTHTHSLGGQPLHKREEGSGVMTIRQLFQCICNTCTFYTVCKSHSWRSSNWLVRTNGMYSPINYDWVCHLVGQPVHLDQPHNNIGDDVEQSDWAVLLAAAVQLRHRHDTSRDKHNMLALLWA